MSVISRHSDSVKELFGVLDNEQVYLLCGRTLGLDTFLCFVRLHRLCRQLCRSVLTHCFLSSYEFFHMQCSHPLLACYNPSKLFRISSGMTHLLLFPPSSLLTFSRYSHFPSCVQVALATVTMHKHYTPNRPQSKSSGDCKSERTEHPVSIN